MHTRVVAGTQRDSHIVDKHAFQASILYKPDKFNFLRTKHY